MGSRGRKKDQKQSRCAIELQDVNIESLGGSELQILTELRQNTTTEYFGGSEGRYRYTGYNMGRFDTMYVSNVSSFHRHTHRVKKKWNRPVSRVSRDLKTAREHSFVSEVSQGTSEAKIALKWTLEGVRRTRNSFLGSEHQLILSSNF